MQGVFVCQTRLKLSGNGNECKPLPVADGRLHVLLSPRLTRAIAQR
jgi:hypothetical protein